MTATGAWEGLLARPVEGNHIAQLYQDDEFLMEALSHFVGSGLAQGDGVVVIATAQHWEACVRRLKSQDVTLQEAELRGQLAVLDAADALSGFMLEGMPDWKSFQDIVGGVINRTRRRYAKIRAFGEIVDILWQRRECLAAMRLEELWNHLVKVQDLSLCCAYRIDNLGEEDHYGQLQSVCEMHSHLIPQRDYDRLEKTVKQASDDVLGPRLASMLHSLAAAHRPATHMPAAQSTLLWLKEHLPLTAGKILSRLREHRDRPAPEVS